MYAPWYGFPGRGQRPYRYILPAPPPGTHRTMSLGYSYLSFDMFPDLQGKGLCSKTLTAELVRHVPLNLNRHAGGESLRRLRLHYGRHIEDRMVHVAFKRFSRDVDHL